MGARALGTLFEGFIMNHLACFRPVIDHRRFVVSQNSQGHWIAREGTGLIEGVFRSQRDAVRFALFESGSPESVVVIAGGASRPPTAH
jgi:hypothetical protein